MTDNCNRPLTRAARQLFRRDASHILLHYFGSSRDAAWRHSHSASDFLDSSDKYTDTSGIERQRIPLVDNPEDGLSDDEWFQLLTYAIESITAQNNNHHSFCPLHPKHDTFLKDDQNSFVTKRRYRFGTKNFGGLSLPLLGRAARTLLWLEERDVYHQMQTSSSSVYNGRPTSETTNGRYTSNSLHLFQCGYCGKTFVSRYYLDRHMDLHHRHLSDTTQSNDDGEAQMICPTDLICDPLGGISACADAMNQISPLYGRGTMLGKEYIDSTRESFFSSSIHSLLEHFHKSDPLESSNDDEEATEAEMPQKYNNRVREGDLSNIVSEIRHRSHVRNKRFLNTLLLENHKQQNQQQVANDVNADSFTDTYDYNIHEHNEEEDLHHIITTASCDKDEMERLFNLCQEMMTNCFGYDDSPNSKGQQHVNLVHDLTEQICQPLHCHHRLHRMAGHTARHMVMWKNEWEENHSYSLGLFGWLVILGLVIFYGCAFMLGLSSDDDWGSNLLPSYRFSRQKKKSS